MGRLPSNAHVVLVSMPWALLHLPSIQLGLLQAVLAENGISVETRSFNLAFMDHLIACGARDGRFYPSVADYSDMVLGLSRLGLGDWIFREADPTRDEAYLAHVASEGVEATTLEKAAAMRRWAPPFLEACTESILASSPTLVGFTVASSQNVATLELAKRLKDRAPHVKVVLGGSNCDGDMGSALMRAFPWIDAVVRGPGEATLLALVDAWTSGAPVPELPGLCLREGSTLRVHGQRPDQGMPLDQLPAPLYDEYFERLEASPVQDLIYPQVALLFQSSRGCWWGQKHPCSFCGVNGSQMAYEAKGSSRVEAEILALAVRHRRVKFEAVDNILSLEHLRNLLPRFKALREGGIDLNFMYETKANLRKDQLRLMKEAGVTALQPGIESLDTEILRLMNKGCTAVQNIRLLKWCAELDIHPIWNLLYGLPGEPPEAFARMAKFIPHLIHLTPPHLRRLNLDRFSPYHRDPLAHGVEILGPSPHYRFLYDLDDATLSDLVYTFQYRYTDGRDPEAYIAPLREAVDQWTANYNPGGLVYWRGPGFMILGDNRGESGPVEYVCGELQSRIYQSCEAGATVEGVRLALEGAAGEDEIRSCLEEMREAGLVFEEDGCYVSLALPASCLR